MSDKTFQGAPVSAQSNTPTASEEQVGRSRAMSSFDELDRMFDSLFAWDRILPQRWERLAGLKPIMPRVDILDKDAEVILRAAIPGMEEQDIDVSVNDRTVTVKGESRKG